MASVIDVFQGLSAACRYAHEALDPERHAVRITSLCDVRGGDAAAHLALIRGTGPTSREHRYVAAARAQPMAELVIARDPDLRQTAHRARADVRVRHAVMLAMIREGLVIEREMQHVQELAQHRTCLSDVLAEAFELVWLIAAAGSENQPALG